MVSIAEQRPPSPLPPKENKNSTAGSGIEMTATLIFFGTYPMF